MIQRVARGKKCCEPLHASQFSYTATAYAENFGLCFYRAKHASDCQWKWRISSPIRLHSTNGHHLHTTTVFPGPPGWAGARRELLYFMVQGEINRGRHTDHPAGRHSIRTNQCPPPPSPQIFLRNGCPSCRPTNSVKALKSTSAFGLGRRC